MKNSLYLGGPFALDIDPDEVVVLVEGEIDAMSIRAAVQDEFESWLEPESKLPYRGVALGGTQGGRTLASVAKLATAKQVIVATDADAAGDECAAWWLDQIPGSVRARPAGAKDMNELLTRYGWQAVIALLEGVGSHE
jgi:5S rRNA maturation endonuclease (ribonuclease M5)